MKLAFQYDNKIYDNTMISYLTYFVKIKQLFSSRCHYLDVTKFSFIDNVALETKFGQVYCYQCSNVLLYSCIEHYRAVIKRPNTTLCCCSGKVKASREEIVSRGSVMSCFGVGSYCSIMTRATCEQMGLGGLFCWAELNFYDLISYFEWFWVWCGVGRNNISSVGSALGVV